MVLAGLEECGLAEIGHDVSTTTPSCRDHHWPARLNPFTRGHWQGVSFSCRQGLDILNLLGGIFFQRKESVQSKLRDVSGVIALDF